ncbi:hypothetical protein FisN_9Lh317 [Fistulifera solaris]|uniref:Adaptor protein ClpS core domain-containing protein n=1 Tax=Fistulifera solaris TaxID=1519565 RepID=A0A1Z5KL11_FISSO|nr:hypothetical protein FisN_9Lh317 [Fistulifera solaris]|eukprot:GAX27004.1 hypothetical protein FisN_9Lh317 [Fistulifera solaris]
MIQLGKLGFYLLTSLSLTTAFAPPRVVSRSSSFLQGATTMEPPTETKSKQGEMMGLDDVNDNDDNDYGDLEYLIDSNENREMEDPFHILLMGSTFEKPKITVSYVSGSLTYVLDMPGEEANELSKFAREQGMSCLGTWPREECLTLGRQLQRRDLVCRVVPFVEGGQRGWQAKDTSDVRQANQA